LELKQGMQHGRLTSPPSKKKPYELVFKDQTIRQILNEVVRKRGRGVWVYSETEWNGVNTFSLDFLVQ
jgi:type II secretory pathway component GspD/PulD (secretin)